MFSVGPEGKWLYVEGARGFCSHVEMAGASMSNGFCVQGDSTASLEGEEDETPELVDPNA